MRGETNDARISRYLSIEWAVAEESAAKLSAFAKQLTSALSEVTETLSEAHKTGDVFKFSSSLTAIVHLLDACSSTVERAQAENYAHYVELLGSRDEVQELGATLLEYFSSGETETTKFDELLQSLGGEGEKLL